MAKKSPGGIVFSVYGICFPKSLTNLWVSVHVRSSLANVLRSAGTYRPTKAPCELKQYVLYTIQPRLWVVITTVSFDRPSSLHSMYNLTNKTFVAGQRLWWLMTWSCSCHSMYDLGDRLQYQNLHPMSLWFLQTLMSHVFVVCCSTDVLAMSNGSIRILKICREISEDLLRLCIVFLGFSQDLLSLFDLAS